MVSPRTIIRLAAMGLLAAGPTTAALVAPSAQPSRSTPQQQAPLRSAGKERPRDLQPVRVSSRPSVGRLSGGVEQKLAAPVAGSGKHHVVPRAVVRPLPQDSPADEPKAPTWVVHRVRDGDSLEQLAAKYLGSPDRAEEILLWNCDRIEDPAMLPLGVELLIPSSGF